MSAVSAASAMPFSAVLSADMSDTYVVTVYGVLSSTYGAGTYVSTSVYV